MHNALAAARPILLVDDDPDDRFLVRQAWKEAGIGQPLRELEGGQQAIDCLSAAAAAGALENSPSPALVLLDLKMPGTSGLDVLAWIRASDAWKRLPVIILTASTSPCDAAEAYRLGANSFVIKPSSIQELAELLAAFKGYWLRFNEFPETPRL